MKHLALIVAAILLLLSSGLADAGERRPVRPPRLPGVDLAEGITELTGVAISPLLGVTTVGMWRYYQAGPVERAALPWFCHPFFWGASLSLLTVCFLKDLFGAAAPPLLKKPLDLLELFENKLSALVACFGFVPFLVTEFALPWWQSPPEAVLSAGALPVASLSLGLGTWLDPRLLLLPLALFWFLTVWMACHAINVLIALCPFGIVDALLKLCKTALLSLVVASAYLSPYLGAAVSIAILLVAALVAPWAFRLSTFGTLFGFDILLPGRAARRLETAEPQAFLARPLEGVPVRTYGRLSCSGPGAFIFTFRPWLVLPRRSITLPAERAAMAKGLLFPSICHPSPTRERDVLSVMFLPRYRSHEQTIAGHFGIAEIRETPLARGFRAVRAWFEGMLSLASPRRLREGEMPG